MSGRNGLAPLRASVAAPKSSAHMGFDGPAQTQWGDRRANWVGAKAGRPVEATLEAVLRRVGGHRMSRVAGAHFAAIEDVLRDAPAAVHRASSPPNKSRRFWRWPVNRANRDGRSTSGPDENWPRKSCTAGSSSRSPPVQSTATSPSPTATASQQVLAQHHGERPAVVRATGPGGVPVLPGSPGIVLPAPHAHGQRGRDDGHPGIGAEREDDPHEARSADADRIRVHASRDVVLDWELARGTRTNDRADDPDRRGRRRISVGTFSTRSLPTRRRAGCLWWTT